ncbi:P-loop containing nucleoside triphosphate hydrolase protein [Cytidiella melzeri]|nr:P-loop containing nucleoside triphosphate hydrolase protein [Cytidiella melzeri]
MLEAERHEDEAVLRERLSSWSLEKLQEEGYCITELRAYWHENYMYGKPYAVFSLGPGIALPPHHRFENGTQVLATHFGPLRQQDIIRGSVLFRTETQLHISFPEKFDLDTELPWRLDIGRSNIVFERMSEAVRQMKHDTAKQEKSDMNSATREVILQGTFLKDILLKSFGPGRRAKPEVEVDVAADKGEEGVGQSMEKHDDRLQMDGLFKDDSRIVSWARRYSQSDPIAVHGDPVLDGLNSTQIRAVAMMVDNRFCLVQGPPGTGKSKTIIETVKLLKKHFGVPHPILICTFTNVAVDNIIEGILSSSLHPLRVGTSGKIKPSLSKCVLENRLAVHPRAPDLEKARQQVQVTRNRMREMRESIRELKAKEKSGAGLKKRYEGIIENREKEEERLRKMAERQNRRAYAIYMDILTQEVLAADVVCTTCISSAAVALNVVDFPIVLVDEASMSTEPATLVPLMKGSKHVALIGDHKQLPPVIASKEAQDAGFGISLFERLAEESFLPSIMLDIQYRMHPKISRFPSHEFYGKSVRDGTIDALGVISPALMPPHSVFMSDEMNAQGETVSRPSVVFLDHVGNESMKDRSRVNWNEANIVCSLVEDLLLRNPGMRGSDIGIIAPYVAQISLLTRLFTIDPKYKARFEAVLGPQRIFDLLDIEIKTVDGFEGREKDIIIFSTVRNNAWGHIGFLADRRRLNVGLTRAKRGLFIVGSLKTLKQGQLNGDPEIVVSGGVGKGADAWRRYADFLSEEKLVVNLKGEQLRRMLYGNVQDVVADAVGAYFNMKH